MPDPTLLKFVELMRKGLEMTKPATECYFSFRDGQQGVYCCPLGATAYAIRPLKNWRQYSILDIQDVVLRTINLELGTDLDSAYLVEHPGLNDPRPALRWKLPNIITDLIDNCGWTREQVLEWVITLANSED